MATRRATAKKAPTKKAAAKKAPAKAKKAAAPKSSARKTAAKKSPAKKGPAPKKSAAKTAVSKYQRREDLGGPVDGFFERHSPEQRTLLDAVRAVILKAVPGVRESMKWGMPYYELKKGICAIYTSPTYVGLNIMAPPDKLDDPEKRLEGSGKTMRHLKVRTAADLHEESLVRWLKAAVAHQS